MKNIDSSTHTRGESIYLDDIPIRRDTLHGAVFDSPLAHGRILALDLKAARSMPGVAAVLTAEDIPGENQIGGIIPDEPLFAEDEVHFMGQPIALVLADSEEQARAATKKIEVEIEPLPVVTDPREARRRGLLIHPPRTFKIGDTEAAWSECAFIFEGRAESGGQEHLYIETQGAYAYPNESGGVRVFSSTQGPTAVQRTAARVLGLPMHKIEVDVTRLGGGFGGKEDQATPWAVMAALGALRLKRATKLVLHRLDDMRMTGKRHPYDSDFKIGLDSDYRILAYEAAFHQNSGAAADLSPAVLERTLFHANNTYFIPNLRATAYPCRTNLPPNTAFRGFGGPQGMFVIESAIAAAAESLGVKASIIQKRNLLSDGKRFHYGQVAAGCQAQSAWREVEARNRLDAWREEIETYNATHNLHKKGLALMPICFGISFTKTHMNQAGALVHIYQDSSLGVSTAAVEMGQGVNTKMAQIAAHEFSIPLGLVKIETTNTTRVANTSPTAASASADLNGRALQMACQRLRERLLNQAATELSHDDRNGLTLREGRVFQGEQKTDLDWKKLVQAAFLNRVNLSEQAHYATPEIHFDTAKEKGHPFAYHVYGAAAVAATVDIVRGTYTIDRVAVVHDAGRSMNEMIDRGQMEGGLVQGIGWMTMEEVVYDDNGRLLSNALSTYKVPDIYAAPARMDIQFLEAEGSPYAIYQSKAVGEPPLMYGIGAYFAVRNAIRAARPNGEMPFSAPITPEKVLLALYGADSGKKSSSGKTAASMDNAAHEPVTTAN